MGTSFISPDEQLDILTRAIVELEVESELRKKLLKSQNEGKPLLVKAGFDPTAPDLHLGHSVLLTKMRQFQNLGHNISFLIGDFTARIGDPTGKSTTRPPLSDDEIVANATTYKKQVFKVLDPKRTFIQFNSEWLGAMNFADVIKLSAKYSVARMIERDDFKNRLHKGQPISMHELLYPLAQGYDSVVMQPDIELGGTDQLFNLLVGRDLMRHFGLEPQCIMTVPLLEGIEAREVQGKIVGDKMSKSLGNYIGLEEEAQTQFGKLMSLCDPLMWQYYDLLSLKSNTEIAVLKKGHPKEAKEALALEIVARYHGEDLAAKAQEQFHTLFGAGKRNEIPKDAPIVRISSNGDHINILKALLDAELVASNGEAKRLVRQGAVAIDGMRVDDIQHLLPFGTHSIRAGKKRWAHIVVE